MASPEHDWGRFLKLPREMSDPESARAVVLPVPYEATTSYIKGTSRGPEAILAASAQVEWYDESRGDEPCRSGIATLPAADCSGPPEAVVERLSDLVAEQVAADRFVVALGGEHTLTIGCARGAAAGEPFTVVQIDAHADLRDQYEGSPWSHACVMRRLSQQFPIVQIGLRSMSVGEAAFAGSSPHVFWLKAQEIAATRCRPEGRLNWIDKAIQAIDTERVYLTVDLDGLDPSVMPGVGTPEPGGLLWDETLAFVSALFESRQVVAADVVELCPEPSTITSDFAAARLTYKIIGHALRD